MSDSSDSVAARSDGSEPSDSVPESSLPASVQRLAQRSNACCEPNKSGRADTAC